MCLSGRRPKRANSAPVEKEGLRWQPRKPAGGSQEPRGGTESLPDDKGLEEASCDHEAGTGLLALKEEGDRAFQVGAWRRRRPVTQARQASLLAFQGDALEAVCSDPTPGGTNEGIRIGGAAFKADVSAMRTRSSDNGIKTACQC